MTPSVADQWNRGRNGVAYLTGGMRPATAQTPRDLVWSRDKARLWRYRGDAAPTVHPPVLIVHSLVSKSYVLDLLPGNSMLAYLVGEGFDVYLLDWEPADAPDAQNTFETYVDHYLPRAVAATCRDSGAAELTVVGYCFGGVLTLLLAGAHPELPIRSMVTLTTPCDYTQMGFMSRMFLRGRLDPEDVIDATGVVPAEIMDDGFQSLRPTDWLVQRANLWQNLGNDRWIEGFSAVNGWARDQVPFPGALFRQTVRTLIRDNALAAGEFPLSGGRRVRLADIAIPYLNVYCTQDTIVPAAAAAPLSSLVGPGTGEELALESGHIGLIAGREAAKVARPRIAGWIRAHSTEQRGDGAGSDGASPGSGAGSGGA